MNNKNKGKKKRKLSLKKIIRFLIVILIIYYLILFLINMPIKNIYISNNEIISDKEIISLANISNYPSFLLTSGSKIKKGILANELVKSAKITKKVGNKVYIDIKEYKILCLDKNSNKLYLENGNIIDNKYNITSVPILNNSVNDIYKNFIAKFSLINDNILFKISEIEYSPVEVDKERFLLKMNDENYVYITLSKMTKLNKYNSIYDKLEGKKGIIYLDSGNYIEIKENN